jgi:hypothetical protein
MEYMYYEGGNDLFAVDKPIIATDLLRGDVYEVQVVDFYIDEMLNGFVYFDGTEILAQSNIDSYDVLERLFYNQFSVQM